MAHTYDNKNTIARARNTSGRDITITLGTGATLIVLVVIVDGLTDRTGGGPVYDPSGANVAMTQVDQNRFVASTGETIVNMWYTTISGVTGSKTIHIPDDNNMYFSADVASFIAAKGTSILVTANGTTGTSSNPTGPTLTGLGPGDVVVSVVGSGYGTWGNANLTAQTGTILYNVDDGGYGHGSQYTITTDSSNQTPGWTESDNEDWAIVAAAFRESRKSFGGAPATTSGLAGNKYLHGFWKMGGAIVSQSVTAIAAIHRRLRTAGAVAASSSLSAAALRIREFLLKTDQWIAEFVSEGTIVFGGAMASISDLAENILLRITLTAATVISASALSGQQRLLNRFSGVAVSVSALAGQGRLLNRFSGAAAAVSGLTGQNNLLNRFSGVVAAISDFSFPNLISRLILGGTAAANAALDVTLTFISAAVTIIFGGLAEVVSTLTGQSRLLNRFSGALTSISALMGQSRLLNRFSGALAAVSSLSFSNLISRLILGGTAVANAVLDATLTFIGIATVIFGGLIAASSAVSAFINLIGLFILKTDQWIAEFVNTYAAGGAFAATSALSAALEYIGGITTYIVGGTIAAVSYTTARVALIVQLLIDQWKATFNTFALGGSLAVSSSLSAMTRLRQLLTAATIAATSALSFGVLQRLYRIAGTIVSASAMSVAAIKSLLMMAGSVAVTSAISAQTILRMLLAAAAITVTSGLSLAAVILRQMFSGLVSSASSLLGKLQYVGGIITVLLAGMIAATSAISFASLIERFRMAGSLAVTSAFSGAARLVWLFTGTIASASTMAFGALRRTFLISGTIRTISSFVAFAIQGATAVIVTVHRLIRPIALLMGRIRGDKRNITK